MAYTKVVIVGGGFAGLNAAKKLAKADVDVLVIDKTNHHLFQPLLYQVATAALSPGDVAAPIRQILRYQANASVIMSNIVEVDLKNQRLKSSSDETFTYDYLILAPGARHSYFGHNEWEEFAPGLKTLADALRIREKIFLAFERAEKCDSYNQAMNFLRFVIIGGGPTGVEMAGDIADIVKTTLFSNFRKIKPEQAEIYLIEGLDRILTAYPPPLSETARGYLEKMGVRVLTGHQVTGIDAGGIYLKERYLETHNIIWAAGNQASPLLATLGLPLDRQGRVLVGQDLSLPGYSNVFVIGDAAHFEKAEGEPPLPGIAPVAIQEGKYVAKMIAKKLSFEQRPPFKYLDKGTIATIGKAKAIGVMGRVQVKGFSAWLAWGFIHIFYLISFEYRLLVMMQWFFSYISGKRLQRLIVNPQKFHDERILEE